jgi:hypothetical protein
MTGLSDIRFAHGPEVAGNGRRHDFCQVRRPPPVAFAGGVSVFE